MIFYHFKIALRRILGNKQFTILNIAGLTIGMSACIVILQYVFFEHSFDRFHKNYQNIYRFENTCSQELGPNLKETFPSVKQYARLHPIYGDATVMNKQTSYNETELYYADASMFELFSFKLIHGKTGESLSQPNTCVISESMGEKYFGTDSPMDKELTLYDRYGGECDYTIKGVFEDAPANSHLQFNMLFSISNVLEHRIYKKDNKWQWCNFITYVKTKVSSGSDQIKTYTEQIYKTQNVYEQLDKEEIDRNAVSITDIHFNARRSKNEDNSSRMPFYFMIIICGLILLVSWINYSNMLLSRSREIYLNTGIHKINGAYNRQIFKQLLAETIITLAIAVSLSIVLQMLALPIIQEYTVLYFIVPVQLKLQYWLIVFSLFFTGLLISIFLPFYNTFKSSIIDLIKSGAGTKHNPEKLIRRLVVFQLTISILLIIISISLTKQLNFLIHKERGIHTEKVIALKSPRSSTTDQSIYTERRIFLESIEQLPEVINASSSVYIPGMYIASNMRTCLKGSNQTNGIDTRMNFAGYSYLKVYGNELVAGRFFDRKYRTDQDGGVIINRKLSDEYGFENPEQAIGQELHWITKGRDLHVVGVIENFHHESPRAEIEPMMIHLRPTTTGYYSIRLESGDIENTLAKLENLWPKYHGENPFDYFFIDAYYAQQFEKQVQLKRVFVIFSIIAIFIACFGLYGFIRQSLNSRTREIGIRKVNGAKVHEILAMLNGNFMKWIGIAFFLATPLGWYAVDRWLRDFAYRTDISWWIFALAGAMIFCVTFLTVTWQSWRAARRNPVESLRYE
jgi:putative ABC transport system permease protein